MRHGTLKGMFDIGGSAGCLGLRPAPGGFQAGFFPSQTCRGMWVFLGALRGQCWRGRRTAGWDWSSVPLGDPVSRPRAPCVRDVGLRTKAEKVEGSTESRRQHWRSLFREGCGCPACSSRLGPEILRRRMLPVGITLIRCSRGFPGS